MNSTNTAAVKGSSIFSLRPHPHLYEINTWAWLEELSARAGRVVKLADVPNAEWDTLAERGFDIVWLMGMWQRSAIARERALEPVNTGEYAAALPGWKPEDVVGSPYAVAQYTPDPRIGTWDDLDFVREKLRARGIALFLDFVGNHTALDHPWVREHPEFYVQGTQQDFEKDPGGFFRSETPSGVAFIACGRDPYFPPWTDTAQLNHFNLGLRAALINRLGIIASHCDGIRCDMAMLQLNDVFERVWTGLLRGSKAPPTEFWEEAHDRVPALVLLAEAYWGTDHQLLKLGFEFVYDKELYDAVRDARIGDARVELAAPMEHQNHLARFLENHDEQRCAVTFAGRIPAAGTLMSTLPGMRFYQQGELEGRKIRLPVALRIAAPETPDPAIVQFFEKILSATNEDVFHRGDWAFLPVVPEGDSTAGNLIVYEWRSDAAWKIIVVNSSGSAAQGRVHLGDRVSRDKQYVFRDELNDVSYPRHGEELSDVGLFVRRDAYSAHLFDVGVS
jgi:Alpha amylase, catalytic domain